ncbi:MAG: ABC transporter permease [Hyphomicrobiaceae bacterium]
MIQLLWIELVAKLAVGLVLLVVPLTAIKVLGLPRPPTAFWPRLLGGVLVGLSAATFMDTTVRLGHGLSLGGAFVINLALGLTLGTMLYLKQGPETRRGRAILWAVTAVLLVLALVEIAYI